MEIDKIKRVALGLASEEEKKEVEEWMAGSEERSRFVRDAGIFYQTQWPEEEEINEHVERMWQSKFLPRRQRSLIRRLWLPAAVACAAVLIGLFLGVFPGGKHTIEQKLPPLADQVSSVQLILPDGSIHELSALKSAQAEIPGFKIDDKITVQNQQPVPDSLTEPIVEYNEIVVPRGGEYTLTLADGTTVILNSDTRMRFPTAFTGTARKIFLSGEAYFKVARDENHPFFVEFPDGQVRVLGTQFNVKAYAGQPTFATLVSGKVEVSSGRDSVVLQPGELCEIAVNDHSLSVREADMMSVLAWKNGEFVFKDVSLEQVMEELSRWYDAEIEYDALELKGMKFNIYMDRAKTLEEALQIISRTGAITYEVKERKIYIKKQ